MHKNTACIFAGQGAQYPGMGKAVVEACPRAKELFDEASSILGYDLSALCFEGPAEKLRTTRWSQPAILVTSVACFEALRLESPGFKPAFGAGLSLGEFSALVASGMISFADGVRLIARRAELMDEAASKTSGAMASIIGLSEEDVSAVCGGIDGVDVANLNCPGQTVVSGFKEAVEASVPAFKARGARRVVVLEVSGAFHSKLMSEAAQGLARALADVKIGEGSFPVISNVTARPHGSAGEVRELLVRQMTSPVLWEKSVRHMLGLGAGVMVEFGPGKVLSGLNRRIDESIASLNVEDAESLRSTREALAAL